MKSSLEILTDGSSHTTPAIFLSLTNSSLHSRYSLAGLPVLTQRLSADQSLSPVSNGAFRCVFLPSHDHDEAAGLAGLFLTLLKAGYARTGDVAHSEWYGEVSVVGPVGTGELVDGILDVVLEKRTRPAVKVCDVPRGGWWEVYCDGCIRAWGRVVECQCQCTCGKRRRQGGHGDYVIINSNAGEGIDSVAYIIAISGGQSFAILPKICPCRRNIGLTLRILPENVTLDFVVHLDPPHETDAMGTNTIRVPKWMNEVTRYHLATFPESFDPGILLRARVRSNLLSKYLPFAFPFTENQHGRPALNTHWLASDHDDQDCVVAIRLKSCTSVLLIDSVEKVSEDCQQQSTLPFEFVSRIEDIIQRCNVDSDSPVDINSNDHYASLRSSLELIYSGAASNIPQQHSDSNEIDLSDDDTPIEPRHLDNTIPHLLLLGTGSATPSPHRGSSSYALLMPANSNLVATAIIECGEGTLHSLSKFLPTESLEEGLQHVRFIWISHSHLDHYGDLTGVVRAVGRINRPVVVIAPSKVLKYLNVMLKSNENGRTNHGIYVGVTHREFQFSPFAAGVRSSIFEFELPAIPEPNDYVRYRPFASLRNIAVEHCREAFALLLEIKSPRRDDRTDPIFALCFSGDTRPSHALIRECRTASPPVSLLLHEATFLNNESGRADAINKRHSTTAEALEVAKLMGAEACLLTHFSQRYTHVSVLDVMGGECNDDEKNLPKVQEPPFPWGIGVDGMIVPLTRLGVGSLHRLSLCVDELLTRNEGVK